jgi:hypothetical protein
MTDWQEEWPPERIRAEFGLGAAYESPDRKVYFSHWHPLTPMSGGGPTIVESRRALIAAGVPANLEERLRPRTVLSISGRYLVEAEDDPDEFWMGQLGNDGVIRCWGLYGSLPQAIRRL